LCALGKVSQKKKRTEGVVAPKVVPFGKIKEAKSPLGDKM
jgi:hypothetical protein